MTVFEPKMTESVRKQHFDGWRRAVETALFWAKGKGDQL
jgi:glycerol kinase